ncbi:beta-ketoacyl-ACP synthase 3 [Nocardia sp. alder85J]|uniref:beta-ketoacyl-ACP synthase 3 n=1 Tax=Nocardia sp. alder85J TaxID=2862949 RepID=UPI0021063E9D|nr:beta-ketoacyl-ACP synthase 3 [Nocardia sp. alder85J]MCX4097070.1 beta-ketoacyl-ACP synthase 3 [Nocardia sp. alder85J]
MPEHAGISMIGSYRPERVVTNEEIAPELGVDEDWIITRTGIRERRFAGKHETVLSMATVAAHAALKAADMDAREIDVVILATSTLLFQTPSGAAIVAAELGCHRPAAFDISAGCSGYAHGIGQAAALVNAGQAENVLVIGSEKLSNNVEPGDRSVLPIFGDGAGAAIVTRTTGGQIHRTVWGSVGEYSDMIRQEPSWEQFRAEPEGPVPYLRMNGTEVFRWATSVVPDIVTEIAAAAGVGLDEIEVFVPHQANLRIIDAVSRRLGWHGGSVVVADDVRRAGNTSAAALPLAIEDLVASGRATPGQLALQVSFGAGLSYAGQVFEMPPVAEAA